MTHLTGMAGAAILLGFSSATQDIVIDAYRIECVEQEMQAMLSASYIAGYRIGMLVAGAGSLALAAYLGTTMGSYTYAAWRLTYFAVGIVYAGGAGQQRLLFQNQFKLKALKLSITQHLSIFAFSYFFSSVLQPLGLSFFIPEHWWRQQKR